MNQKKVIHSRTLIDWKDQEDQGVKFKYETLEQFSVQQPEERAEEDTKIL